MSRARPQAALDRGGVELALDGRAHHLAGEGLACERSPDSLRAGVGDLRRVVSRVVAIQQVAGLEALPEALETRLLGAWPFLDGLRNARDGGEESPNHVVRRACLEGLQALVGGAAELTFDPSADQATRDAQLEALEAWFEANGGERPDGVPSFSEWAASLAEPDASGDPTSPESGDGAGK